MNKVSLALAATSVALTLLSIHLWRQLDAERDRSQAAVMERAELRVRLAKLERQQHSAPAPGITPTAPLATGVVQSTAAAPRRETGGSSDADQAALVNARLQQRWQEARRRMLEDPRERELLKAQARSEARAANRDLALELQLSDAEFDRLIELLAEHELQVAAAYSRAGTIGNDTFDGVQALRDQLAQDIATLLGHEKAEQYAAFDDSRQVRTQVRRLRGQLSEADALTPEQTQRLIAALQEQRVRFNDEIKQRVPRERVSGSMGTWDGASVVADSTSRLPVHEQLMRQLEEFRKRQRQGAAAVLTARQLRVFDQMQEEMLTDERVHARTRTLADQSN